MSTQAEIERSAKWNREHRAQINARRKVLYALKRKPRETEMERFERSIERITESGCWIWMSCSTRGYGVTAVNKRPIRAHRWAWKLFVGEIPDGLFVCHRCDVPTCCNPAHLFLGTALDNNRDSWSKGRRKPLAIHRQAKLSEQQVREIRAAPREESNVALGKKYGVHDSSISCIRSGKFWRHLL